MTDTDAGPACRRCGRPVRVNRDQHGVFEGMHYVCFHYEFEHDPADVDEDCGAPGCPAAPAARQKDRMAVAVRALLQDWTAGPPADWANHSLPDYLEALAAWLEDCDGYYASRSASIPWNAWEVMRAAMRAATVYE